MAEVVLKRKIEDDSMGHTLRKRMLVILEGRSLSIPLTEWPECSKLLSDASEAIHLAIKKIEILENYFQKVDENVVSKGESEYTGVYSLPKCEVQVMEADGLGTTQKNNVSADTSMCSDMKTEETNHEHNTLAADESMVEDQLLNISNEEIFSFETFMANLNKGIKEEELAAILDKYGLRNFVICLKHRCTNSFAFVKYSDEENFNKALRLNKVMVDQGRKIIIRVCEPKRPKSGRKKKIKENKDYNSAN